MAKYVCSVCGFVYDEAKGIPESGITPGTKWEDLPADWVCPLCAAEKSAFKIQEGPKGKAREDFLSTAEETTDFKEMTPLELSALCSNLALGCEKQYKVEEAALFMELAEYFNAISTPAEEPGFNQLFGLIEKDLEESFPRANALASDDEDRGALRALVWSEKVTRILKSIMSKYQREGEAMLENTGVYVCTICGFIYIGNTLPNLCPVCKVANWKFEAIEGRK